MQRMHMRVHSDLLGLVDYIDMTYFGVRMHANVTYWDDNNTTSSRKNTVKFTNNGMVDFFTFNAITVKN